MNQVAFQDTFRIFDWIPRYICIPASSVFVLSKDDIWPRCKLLFRQRCSFIRCVCTIIGSKRSFSALCVGLPSKDKSTNISPPFATVVTREISGPELSLRKFYPCPIRKRGGTMQTYLCLRVHVTPEAKIPR